MHGLAGAHVGEIVLKKGPYIDNTEAVCNNVTATSPMVKSTTHYISVIDQ